MFYVRERIGDAVEVSVEINDENVFTRCPRCGKEVPVDLAELFHCDEDSDLYGTGVFCDECGKVIRNSGCEHGCK